MNPIFADACYWIALLSPKDQLHQLANAARSKIGNAGLITTDEVLTEVLNHFSAGGQQVRILAADSVDNIRAEPRVAVVPQSRESFDSALALYRSRKDKQFSLVDCRSFVLMRQRGITEALTDDHHFGQEGLTALL